MVKFKHLFNKGILTLLMSPILGGCLYALGFPTLKGYTFSLAFILPIIGFFILNCALEKQKKLIFQLLLGSGFSLGFYLMGFYWVPHTLKEFGSIPFPFNQLLGLVFSTIITPQIYFFILLKRYLTHPLLLGLAYALLEIFIPQEFPAHLGHPFLSLTPNINLFMAPIAGAAFYSFLSATTSLALFNHLKLKRPSLVSYVFIILFYGAHVTSLLFPQSYNNNKSNLPTSQIGLRVIQPNIGNFIKIDSEKGGFKSIQEVYDRYFYLSTHQFQVPKELILWPETAFPNLMLSSSMNNNKEMVPNFLLRIIEKTQTPLFIGGYDSSIESDHNSSYQSNYNAAFYFETHGLLQNVYRKMILIPFGEGLPFGPLNHFLSQHITNIAYFASGDKYTGFKSRSGHHFVSVICYEILFPHFLSTLLNAQGENHEAQFLINLTNDSWYGDTAEPHQHLFLSRWRALEFNLPIIRSTNTGITTIINADGSEGPRLGINEQNYLDLNFQFSKRSKTIFQKFGVIPLIGICALFILFEIAFKRKSLLQEFMKPNKS